MTSLLDLSYSELKAWLAEQGQPTFRAKQLYQWFYAKGVASTSQMHNVPKALRLAIDQLAPLSWPEIADLRISSDQTAKFLLQLADGARIECVLIPERDHFTLCISTQVGCALGCTFCSTGRLGFTRNLTQGEIIGQALLARHWLAEQKHPLPLRNLVFMGMGEPMLNIRQVLRALTILADEQGGNFSPRRITVSTVGLEKGLMELGESGLASLAVSLHAPTQQLREQIMPAAARSLPLSEMMPLLTRYPLRPRQRLTFEYVLLGGVNDSLEHAQQLVRLLSHKTGQRAKINLIAYNPPPEEEGRPYRAPNPEQVVAFEKHLHDKGFTATIRKSKGQDIAAACGQLALKTPAPDA